MPSSSISSPSFAPPPKADKPRRFYTRFGQGRALYEQQQADQMELEAYITTLEGERQYPSYVLDALRNLDYNEINLQIIFSLVKHICRTMGDGAILIFLPGWDTISKMNDIFLADPVFRSRNYIIIPLHSMMPTAFQQKVQNTGSFDPSPSPRFSSFLRFTNFLSSVIRMKSSSSDIYIHRVSFLGFCLTPIGYVENSILHVNQL